MIAAIETTDTYSRLIPQDNWHNMFLLLQLYLIYITVSNMLSIV